MEYVHLQAKYFKPELNIQDVKTAAYATKLIIKIIWSQEKRLRWERLNITRANCLAGTDAGFGLNGLGQDISTYYAKFSVLAHCQQTILRVPCFTRHYNVYLTQYTMETIQYRNIRRSTFNLGKIRHYIIQNISRVQNARQNSVHRHLTKVQSTWKIDT